MIKVAIEYIKSDLYRYTGRSDGRALLRRLVCDRTMRWHIAFRLMQWCRDCWYGTFVKMIWRLWRGHSIEIPYTAKIGYGLYVGHGGPLVVNPTAVIGNNCNLSQFTKIGSNDGRSATIGSNVYVGPNVCIVEDVVIGSNVTIGAGSVVTKDIPENATAVGNYAKVINYNNPGRYIQNAWRKR